VSFEVSWASHQLIEGRDYGVDLMGTTGGLSLYPARLVRNGPLGYETIQLSAPKVPLPEDRIQHFINCVLDDKKPAVSVEESLKVQQVLDAIYTSSTTGKEVRLG
jgi:predicted dehydrogenase